jgi:gas vesicle protein
MQLEQDKLAKQKSQLEQQVSFVKDNAAATIERLTRYREQAQEKIEKLEKKLSKVSDA